MLEALAIVVPLGVGLVIVAVWRFGRSSDPLTEAVARAEFAEKEPTRVVEDVTLAADGRGALLATEGCFGVVFALGDKWVTRVLEPKTIAGVEHDGTHLQIALRDITAPRIELAVGADWVDRLS